MTTLVALLVLAPLQRTEVKPHPFFSTSMMAGAHRGGLTHYPENTVVAFREVAKRYPGMVLETDARMTTDGTVVLLHDVTVDRTTDGTGDIRKKSLAEVKRLDAGYRFRREGGFPYRGKGVTVATLAEALRAAPKSRFLIDIKDDGPTARAVLDVIRAEKAENRVMLASFIPAAMQVVRTQAPNLPRCYSFDTGAALLGALRSPGKWEAYVPQDDVLSLMKETVEQFKLTPDEVAKIRAKGVLFQIHTLNTAEEIRKWRAIGVDSILTDDPELLTRELALRK